MKRLVLLLLSGVALWLGACNSGDQASRKSQAPGGSGADSSEMFTKSSGVRYQEIAPGAGDEVEEGSFVEFDYACWLADGSGLQKLKGIGTSVGRPGESFKAEVGVQPLPGLSDGLIGMRYGGSRRIFVPQQLGFKPGTMFQGRNVIFEVFEIKESTPEKVTRHHDSVAQWMAEVQRIQDSMQKAVVDSLAALGLDSLGEPLDRPVPAEPGH